MRRNDRSGAGGAPARVALGLALAATAAGACSKPAPEPPDTQTHAVPPTSAPPASSAVKPASAPQGSLEAPPFDFQLGPLPNAGPFEGLIHVQVVPDSTAHRTELVTFAVRGARVRWNLPIPDGQPGAGSYRIYDGAAHRFYTVVPERKTAFLTEEAALAAKAAPAGSYRLTPDGSQPRGLVGGIPCEHLLARDGQLQYSVCAARKIGPLPFQLLEGFSSVIPFGQSLEDQDLFPLDVTARRAGPGAGDAGPVAGTFVVIETTRGSVPDIAYGIPHPYARVSADTLDMNHLLR